MNLGYKWENLPAPDHFHLSGCNSIRLTDVCSSSTWRRRTVERPVVDSLHTAKGVLRISFASYT